MRIVNRQRVKLPKTGIGTDEEPFRPDHTADPRLAELHAILDAFRMAGKEIRNVTFYVMQVRGENPDGTYDIEIMEVERTIDEWIEWLKKKAKEEGVTLP